MELPQCDDSVPGVVLANIPALDPSEPKYPMVKVMWLGEESTDRIRIVVKMTNTKNGPTHDVNYMQVFQDVDSPGRETAEVGNTLNGKYRYMLAIRRERDGLASPWTTVFLGNEHHTRAFSQGFAVGFQ